MSTRSPMPIIPNGSVPLPWFRDHEAFRRWAREERPERGRFAYLGGTLWVDLTLEQADTHNEIKGEIAAVLGSFARTAPKGRYLTDGMLITHVGARLSTVPDGSFYLLTSEAAGRIVRIPNVRGVGCVELQGTLDMVLEVVSESSVEKDTVTMPALYHAAGVPEFWRVNALGGAALRDLPPGRGGVRADGAGRRVVPLRSVRP
jgi:Uma2 family endonuclease